MFVRCPFGEQLSVRCLFFFRVKFKEKNIRDSWCPAILRLRVICLWLGPVVVISLLILVI